MAPQSFDEMADTGPLMYGLAGDAEGLSHLADRKSVPKDASYCLVLPRTTSYRCSILVISSNTRGHLLDSQRKPRSVGPEVSTINRDCVNDQARLVKPSVEADLEKISPANTRTRCAPRDLNPKPAD